MFRTNVSLLNGDITFVSETLFIHRWPHDTPIWGDSIQNQLDDTINKKNKKKQITIKEKTIKIDDFEFFNLKKIGISVPFFKNECRIIFEAQFGDLFGHIHITCKSKDFLDIFNQLILWKKKFFSNDSK